MSHLVDDIIRQQKIVVKQVGGNINSEAGYMGTAILENGLPTLIIDLENIIVSEYQNMRKRGTENATGI